MFYITVSNGLLRDGHQKRIGSAVWEFMWLIDKVTRIEEDGMGWVLGGKPINLKDIADDLEIHESNVSRNLKKLVDGGYISINRTPYGLQIKVIRAKKNFKRIAKTPNLNCENAKSRCENAKSNKTVSVDSNSMTLGAKRFFENKDKQETFIQGLLKTGEYDENNLRLQIKAFISWYTETPEDETEARWQKQSIFNLKTRLENWFARHKEVFKPQTYALELGRLKFKTKADVLQAEKDGIIGWDRREKKWVEQVHSSGHNLLPNTGGNTQAHARTGNT